MNVVAASRPRCLAVAIGLTAALWGAAAVLVRALAAGQPATPDEALVRLCLGALAAGRGLGLAAGHGRRGRRVARVRPPAGSAATPAGAGRLRGGPGRRTRRPGPRRRGTRPTRAPTRCRGCRSPSGPRARRTRAPTAPVVVRPGDTLWSLAEHDLPAAATDRQVAARWHALYRRNRGVIGPDPDLIRPGQVLRLTAEGEAR